MTPVPGDTGLAGFSINSEKSPKIPIHTSCDYKTHGESGFSKYNSVCELKIVELIIGIGRHRLRRFFQNNSEKFQKILKNLKILENDF